MFIKLLEVYAEAVADRTSRGRKNSYLTRPVAEYTD